MLFFIKLSKIDFVILKESFYSLLNRKNLKKRSLNSIQTTLNYILIVMKH
jgi:hypothetical protein